MNKFVLLLIVAAAGALVYFKLSEPKIPSVPPAQQQPAAVKTDSAVSEDSGQQALPEDAKNITAEIKKEKGDSDPRPKELVEAFEKSEERSKAEIKRIENQQKLIAFMPNNPAAEIPMEFGTSYNSLKWPCKSASFAEIMDSYSKIWGKSSVEPHDSSWYATIAGGLTEYALCRAVATGTPDVCLGLDLLKEGNEFSDIIDECKDSANLLNVYLYSLNKASRSECEKFPAKSPKSSLCSEITKHRGASLCDSLGIAKSSKERGMCMSLVPETTSDCSGLKGFDAKACVGNLQLYNALKANNPKLCPQSGKPALVCLSYFSKNTKNFCQQYMDNVSKNFCSGGKYFSTRRPNY